MDWMQIGSALLLGAMIVMLFPGVRRAAKNAPKGSLKVWMGYIVPMAVVTLFIILLIAMV